MYNLGIELHFIGIGGVGMAGIAEVLLNLGYRVSGSDLKRSPLTDHLERLGARFSLGHCADNIPPSTSVVVVSSAVPPNNAELLEALRRKMPVIPRAEMLAELMRMKYGIAIAGSHGKTTTTCMTAKILDDAGMDPTVIIGGRVQDKVSGAKVGTGQYLVAEADESDGSFCLLRPAIAVVTNIDREHLTYYGSFRELERSFFDFMSSVPFYGLVVACADDPVIAGLLSECSRRVVTYGFTPGAVFRATDVELNGKESCFSLWIGGEKYSEVSIPVPGSHMVLNSLAAIAVGIELGVYPAEACSALASFSGVSRRTEIVACEKGVLVIDDYAHHPTEIRATLNALRHGWLPRHSAQYADAGQGRLICVFQPHRYSRTHELFADFLHAFADADELIIGEIYPAGEEAIPGISGERLCAAMQHPSASFAPDLEAALSGLSTRVQSGDMVVALGAGSITHSIRKFGALLG